MLDELKEKIYIANIELVKKGLVVYTWGNVSGIDSKNRCIVIKPSGVEYEKMTPDDMVVVDIDTGRVIEGKWHPSSDTSTHIELYKAFPEIGGITHTHSVNSVAFAQAGMRIPALGTTHADYFCGDIPCTRELTQEEVEHEYEKNTGKVIVETVKQEKYNVMSIPGIILKNHGPFAWGKDAQEAVYHAVVMEKVAEMAWKTLMLNSKSDIRSYILDKHYLRKHGEKAYYGQRKS